MKKTITSILKEFSNRQDDEGNGEIMCISSITKKIKEHLKKKVENAKCCITDGNGNGIYVDINEIESMINKS